MKVGFATDVTKGASLVDFASQRVSGTRVPLCFEIKNCSWLFPTAGGYCQQPAAISNPELQVYFYFVFVLKGSAFLYSTT